MQPVTPLPSKRPLVYILVMLTLLTGALDLFSAFIINPKVPPPVIMKYIASAVLGSQAFAGGVGIVILGLLLHYIIAFAWGSFIFITYPLVSRFVSIQAFTIFIYGSLVWCVMNLVVVPLSLAKTAPFTAEKILLNMLAIILCIALPSVLFARRYYQK